MNEVTAVAAALASVCYALKALFEALGAARARRKQVAEESIVAGVDKAYKSFVAPKKSASGGAKLSDADKKEAEWHAHNTAVKVAESRGLKLVEYAPPEVLASMIETAVRERKSAALEGRDF